MAKESNWYETRDLATLNHRPPVQVFEHAVVRILSGVLITLFMISTLPSVAMRDWGVVLFELYCLLGTLFLCRKVTTKSGKASQADEDLVEAPMDRDVLLVEVEIWQEGGLTGVDRGLLCLDESRLLFSGHRSSFALTARDAISGSVERRELQFRFRLSDPSRVELRISALERSDCHERHFGYGIIASAVEALKFGESDPEPSVIPPLRLDPKERDIDLLWLAVPTALRIPCVLAVWGVLYTFLMAFTDGQLWRSPLGFVFQPVFLCAVWAALFLHRWTLGPFGDLCRSLVVRRRLRRGSV